MLAQVRSAIKGGCLAAGGEAASLGIALSVRGFERPRLVEGAPSHSRETALPLATSLLMAGRLELYDL